VARDADDRAVVEFGPAAFCMLAKVVSVKRAVAKIATAALTFAISGDEKLTDLARRKETAAV
jgi:hypothetical protein